MNCKDCFHYKMCDYGRIGRLCSDFTDKSEWVHLPCKKGDVLIKNGEMCTVDHWNVLATAFTESDSLRVFNVKEAEKALKEMKKLAGMTIEKASERLRGEYEKARATQYVNDPVAYALYNVWKEADKASEKSRSRKEGK